MRYGMLEVCMTPVVFLVKLAEKALRVWRRIFHAIRLKAGGANVDFSIQCDGPVFTSGTGKILIGKRCRLGRGTELRTEGNGQITIGDDVRINTGCMIVAHGEVVISDYAIIGEYVSIRDANHGMDPSHPMRYQPHSISPVKISRDVWVGRGSCILPGRSIGEGSVVGANSVVTEDIPPFSVAAGIPARVIKKREADS